MEAIYLQVRQHHMGLDSVNAWLIKVGGEAVEATKIPTAIPTRIQTVIPTEKAQDLEVLGNNNVSGNNNSFRRR